MTDRLLVALPWIIVLLVVIFYKYYELKQFKRKNCTNCRYFNAKHGKCELLRIYEMGRKWQCNKWERKEGEK